MRNLFFALLAGGLFFTSCSKSDNIPDTIIPVDSTTTPITSPSIENFESGNKIEYTSASIPLTTGKWSFDNALIGTDANDKKNGSKSARLQESGKLSMNFDVVGGVFILSMANASYGADAAGSFSVWASANSGVSYTQVGIINTTGVLKTDSLLMNYPSKVRFQFRKTAGAAKINIDDIRFINVAIPPAPSTADDNNLLLGNPSTATYSIFNNYLMVKPYYALSYNKDEGKANWVSWHLDIRDLGTTSRQDDFRDDPDLPAIWYHATNTSYNGGGFDRGHNCPSGDRTATVPMNSSTFLMTNIMPQAPANNQGVWAHLEDSCRLLVQSGKEVFIICGSYGSGGTGNNGFATTIDNGNITVPSKLWKVIVVLPNGNSDYSRMSTGMRVIAVTMANDNGVNNNWKQYRTSVDAIEAAIGNNFDLLSNLPQSIQTVVEARVDNL